VNKIIKKGLIFVFIFLLGFMWLNPDLYVQADQDQIAADYGFYLDDDYFDTNWFDSVTVINVYMSGKFLGSATEKVGIARRNILVNNKFRDTVLIRFQLEPADTKYGSSYYHGINKEGSMSLTIASGQTYVNYAPDSSPVIYSDTVSFSLGGTVNNKGEFGGTLGIGASTSYTTDGFTILSKMSNVNKTYTTRYLYQPNRDFFGSEAKRARNRFLNTTHKEFAMYQYDASSEYSQITVNYNVIMWGAISGSEIWGGRTWEVVLNNQGQASSSVTYTKNW
jgi:hypothetical protein